ncbi:MAG: DNA repair protein RecO [Synergistaceae bacterium]|nr:DNA repair protein RecO [Synergistaceae bacterium]
MISSSELEKLPQGYYKKVGTVLQRRDSSGEGQSLLLFLRDMGPMWVSAPSSKTKCRFGGATEPLVWSEFDLYQSPARLYLQGAEVKEDFLSLRSSAEKLKTALTMYKRLSKILMIGHECNNILTLLWSSVLLLKENCPVDMVEYRFTYRLLKETGLAPSLQYCVKCGSKLTEGAAWTSDGLICRECSDKNNSDIDAAGLKYLKLTAFLKHDKFIEWSGAQGKLALYGDELKKLLTFFTDMD